MKKSIVALSSAFLLLNITANAAVLTVSNNPNSPGQYTDLQAACNAASNNDTIYVHGSPTQYPSVDVMKPLVIIGAGALPDKEFRYSTRINQINFKFASSNANAQSGAGSKLYGCDVNSITFYPNSGHTASVTNVLIERNRIISLAFNGTYNNLTPYSGVVIKNNIINSIGGGGKIGFIQIRNNIIVGGISSIGDRNQSGGWVLANNIIKGGMGGINRASIYNNIFYGYSGNVFGSGNNLEYCSISNNCIIGAQNYSVSNVIYGTNTGGDNLLNTDPQFIQDGTGSTSIESYSYSSPATGPFVNYHLQAGSPCIGANASDGTQIGIYGGGTPFFEGIPNDSRYRYFPMPNIPAMLDMNIINSNVIPNGTLNVEFKARKQN